MNKIVLIILTSFILLSCAEEEERTAEPVKTLNDNWNSSTISAELTIMDNQSIAVLQLLNGNSPLGLRAGDYMLSRILSDGTSCVCGTDFIGNDSSGSFTINPCEISGSQITGSCSSLITSGSYVVVSNQLILSPSSGSDMLFE